MTRVSGEFVVLKTPSFVERKLRGLLRRANDLFKPDPMAFLRNCGTIVHVGANSGQEREQYSKYQLAVLWVEPIPDVFDRLCENIVYYPKQRAIRALVTDRDGDIRQLNIASNEGASSSILDLALHKDVWPDIHYVDRIDVITTTLDTLLKLNDAPNIDAIILDTQGSELLVLKGATQALANCRYVLAECADFESYVECATVDSISAYLRQHSFFEVRRDKFAEQHPNGGAYFDVLFEKTFTVV